MDASDRWGELSGGGGSSGTSANASNEQGTRSGDASKPGRTAEPLTSQELISRADRICDESQSTYKSIRDPSIEEDQ